MGFVDNGEESRLVVCCVWVGANLFGWKRGFCLSLKLGGLYKGLVLDAILIV